MDITRNTSFTPDPCQLEVINAEGGLHLVLAPPGCGKTQILTERIHHAHYDLGVNFADMICLTFTNRAARGMVERIASSISDDRVEEVFVGNVHRFCSKFLFSQGLVPAESSVIDEDDAVSILARFTGDEELDVLNNFKKRRDYSVIFHLEAMMHQITHGHPKDLRVHPECISGDDISAMRRICKVVEKPFDADAMIDIYEHSDTYMQMVQSQTSDYGDWQTIYALLRKMSLARQYHDYKRENRLLDFQDLLMFTYDALSADRQQMVFKRYSWVQVDEVQDLNSLQMAIIRLLTSDKFRTVMFLGDEQQAIFSFMGAKLDVLSAIKAQPSCVVHHLSVNHRSPKYLLEIFNTYANEVLHIDKALLPDVGNVQSEQLVGNEINVLCSETYGQEVHDCVQFAKMLSDNFPDSTTALIVNANRDAEDLSAELTRLGIRHFKVSGTDLFASSEIKLLLAHLSVLNNEFSFMAWARIIKGMRVYEQSATARSFVRRLLDCAIMPSDLLNFDDNTTYLQHFVSCYEENTIVVFDTETTGLDVFHDDILQIAAVKMRCGQVVEGSEFTVYIETNRCIPAMLGDIVNPIVEERKHHTLLGHAEALQQFMTYAEGCVLLGHNADYDYNILDFNLRRYVPNVDLHTLHPRYIDSLRLVRLLHPDLKEHKLKYLLEALGLEGCNSHLADDDVNATRSVVVDCYNRALPLIERQKTFLSDSRVAQRVAILRSNYAELYHSAVSRLYDVSDNGEPAVVAEMSRFYSSMTENGLMTEIEGLNYVKDYISLELIDSNKEPSLHEQLSNHVMEICTLKEADLCGSRSIRERIFVTTIHKAKGLEFDNVIVFDAVDGRMPNFFSAGNARLLAEDARKFYVALSRAKKRLYVSQCILRYDYHNVPHDVHLAPFMRPISKYFNVENFSQVGER